MEKYDKIIEVLRQVHPAVTNPDKLKETILQKIKNIPQDSSFPKEEKLRRKIIVWISGIAAGLLLCSLISSTIIMWKYTEKPIAIHSFPEISAGEIQTFITSPEFREKTVEEQNDLLRKAYISHQKRIEMRTQTIIELSTSLN